MIGVTIAIGKTSNYDWRVSRTYKEYAEVAAINVKKFLGLEKVIILTEEHLAQLDISHIESYTEKCFYLKFFIFKLFPEIDRFLYFDTDWNCYNSPYPIEILSKVLNSESLVVVRGNPCHWFNEIICKTMDVDPFRSFNAGFFIANRENHYSFFEKCINSYLNVSKIVYEALKGHNPQIDQCVMNYVAAHYNYPIYYTNRMWNLTNKHMWVFDDENPSFLSRFKCVAYHSIYNFDNLERIINNYQALISNGDIEVDQEKMLSTSGLYLFINGDFKTRIFLLSDGYTNLYEFEWLQDIDGNVYIIDTDTGSMVLQLKKAANGLLKSNNGKLIKLS